MIDAGFSRSFRSWQSMMRRCIDPLDAGWPDYGGRGITICGRWYDFRNFLVDMGERPAGMTLERDDNNQGYCKENCRWADRTTQARNTRRNVNVTVDGKKMLQTDAALLCGVSDATIMRRRLANRPLNERRGLKLTEAKARAIKAHGPWWAGDDAKLAVEFGISRQAVSMIRRGVSWAWLK